MAEFGVIAALLKIIDRLIQLKAGRIQSRKENFRDIFQATYEDLTQIHGDYIDMFESLRVYSANEPNINAADAAAKVNRAKKELRARRTAFAHIRTKVKTLVAQLEAEDWPPEERAFINTVARYFPNGEPAVPQSAATSVLRYLESDLEPAEIDLLIGETIQAHNNAWSDVTRAFGTLRIAISKLGSPPRGGDH